MICDCAAFYRKNIYIWHTRILKMMDKIYNHFSSHLMCNQYDPKKTQKIKRE